MIRFEKQDQAEVEMIRHIRIVLDSLLKDHGMLAVLYQLEMLCRQRTKKMLGEDAEEWQAAAEELRSIWNNLCELNLLH